MIEADPRRATLAERIEIERGHMPEYEALVVEEGKMADDAEWLPMFATFREEGLLFIETLGALGKRTWLTLTAVVATRKLIP